MSLNYYSSWSQKTLNEDALSFRNMVVELATKDKREWNNIFHLYDHQIMNSEINNVAKGYFTKLQNAGAFTSKSKILEESLKEMYKILLTVVSENIHTYNNTATKDSFKAFVRDEAANLLSGSIIFSTEVATKETEKLRNIIEAQVKNIHQLKEENGKLSMNLESMSKTITNLVSNLKNTLGLKNETIQEYKDKHFNELNPITEQDLLKAHNLGYYNHRGANNNDNPSGQTESILTQVMIYGKSQDLFIIKTQQILHDSDGFSNTTPTKFERVNYKELLVRLKEFENLNPERNKMAVNSITHNTNSFIQKKDIEEMNTKIKI